MSDDKPYWEKIQAQSQHWQAIQGQVGANTYAQPVYVSIPKAQFDEMAAHIDRLQARVTELAAALATIEATHAVTLGTLEQPTDDAPFRLEHDVPANTPR